MIEREKRQVLSNFFNRRFSPYDYEIAGSHSSVHGSYQGGGGLCCDNLIEYLAVGIALFALMMTSMSRKRRKRSDEVSSSYWALQYLYSGKSYFSR